MINNQAGLKLNISQPTVEDKYEWLVFCNECNSGHGWLIQCINAFFFPGCCISPLP